MRNITFHVKPILPSTYNNCMDLYYPTKLFAKHILPIYEHILDKNYRADFLYRIFQPNFLFCSVDALSQLIISPNGELYKCSDSFNSSDAIGKLSEGGKINFFPDTHIKWLGKDAFEFDECKDCDILPICGGGCTMKRIYKIDTPCPEYKYNLNKLLLLVNSHRHLIKNN